MTNSALDAAIFGELRELMGETMEEFIKTYIENTPRLIDNISHALSENNTDSIYNAAHQIKGGSGSIGALGLANVAYEIEIITKSGSIDGVPTLLDQLQSEYTKVEAELKNI